MNSTSCRRAHDRTDRPQATPRARLFCWFSIGMVLIAILSRARPRWASGEEALKNPTGGSDARIGEPTRIASNVRGLRKPRSTSRCTAITPAAAVLPTGHVPAAAGRSLTSRRQSSRRIVVFQVIEPGRLGSGVPYSVLRVQRVTSFADGQDAHPPRWVRCRDSARGSARLEPYRASLLLTDVADGQDAHPLRWVRCRDSARGSARLEPYQASLLLTDVADGQDAHPPRWVGCRRFCA